MIRVYEKYFNDDMHDSLLKLLWYFLVILSTKLLWPNCEAQKYENHTQSFSSFNKKQSSSFTSFLQTFQQKDICQDISLKITAAYSKDKSGENCKKRGYQCSFCDKTFTRRENLLSHTGKVHTGENYFVCHVCNKSFSQKGNLKTHMRIHVGY